MDFDKLLNPNIVNVKPSGIRKFFSIAEEMSDVISLGVGEPDFLTPWSIRRVGIESLERGSTRYTANAGLAELKGEISKYYSRKYNVSYDPAKEVLVTVGGSEAIDMCIRCLVCPGDEVLVVEPSFVCYRPIIEMCGGKCVPIVTKEEEFFKLTAGSLRQAITEKTKLLVLPFPNNPTGGVMRREDLEDIANVIEQTDIMILSDEIYSELTFGEQKHVTIASIASMRNRTVVVNGFSKTYSMTGWRLGYALGNEKIIEQMTKLHQFAIMSAPTTSQYSAIEALRNGDSAVAQMYDEYDMRRRYVVDAFNSIGLHTFEGEGAFYCFPCIKSTSLTSEQFCERLINEQRVAVVPGDAFGECGEGYIRVSYCYSISNLKEAIRRIALFLENIERGKNEN